MHGAFLHQTVMRLTQYAEILLVCIQTLCLCGLHDPVWHVWAMCSSVQKQGSRCSGMAVVWQWIRHILDSLIHDGHFSTPLSGLVTECDTGRVCMIALLWQSL
jgi:hypothetical protein